MRVYPSLLTHTQINLRDLGHSDGADDIYPVDIRLIRSLDGWLFNYITDFRQGLDPDAERCTEVLPKEVYHLRGCGA